MSPIRIPLLPTALHFQIRNHPISNLRVYFILILLGSYLRRKDFPQVTQVWMAAISRIHGLSPSKLASKWWIQQEDRHFTCSCYIRCSSRNASIDKHNDYVAKLVDWLTLVYEGDGGGYHPLKGFCCCCLLLLFPVCLNANLYHNCEIILLIVGSCFPVILMHL